LTETFRDYLRIKEAARLIGVSEATLRNWGKQGKIKVHRHPVNGYRLFKRRDLEEGSSRREAFSRSRLGIH
jgi:excisionase family DNA binding protein